MNIGMRDIIMTIKNQISKYLKQNMHIFRIILMNNYLKKYLAIHLQPLADKLINTTNKEENQIIIDDIKKNRDKLYEQDDFNNFIIQPGYKLIDLTDAAKIVLEFNEVLSLNDDDND